MNSFYFFLKTPTFRQNQFWNSSMRSEEIDRELGARLPQLGRLPSAWPGGLKPSGLNKGDAGDGL